MTALEAGLRGGAIALFLLLATISLRDARRLPLARYAALFSGCGIAYMIESAPPLAIAPSPAWLVPLRVLSATGPAVFQLWASASFDDAFRPHWWRWLPIGAMAALALWATLINRYLPWRFVNLACFGFVAAGIWQAMAGRAGDLIETRRRFRLILAISAGLCIGSLTLLAFFATRWLFSEGTVMSAGMIAALALASCVLGLGLRFAEAVAPVRVRPAATAADPEERLWLDNLKRLMEEERIYREEGFGIAALADRMRIPEYRLRRLINQRLGHRNFTGFVNTYRLGETIAALSDPSQAQVPILTIALDAGFQSLGPFNRAFKAETGVTPTEFRRAHAVGRAAD